VNTEIKRIKEISELRGWVLYDGNCPYCCRWAARLEKVLTRRGFDLASLQSPWVNECLDLRVPEIPGEMLVLTTDGQLFGGAEAMLFLARRIWWATPLYLLGLLPVAHQLMVKAYNTLAQNRMCLGSACAMFPAKKRGL
jgi:predicted DCC family thiol-disulfide oxidoreductase YuxK